MFHGAISATGQDVAAILEDARAQVGAPTPSRRWSPSVERALNIVHEQLFNPNINVKVLKEQCKLHDNNFSCQFRHEVGVSMKSYIDLLRMYVAVFVLDRCSVSIVDLAFSLGYEHVQTFYRVFKRHFASTPGAHRCVTSVSDCFESSLISKMTEMSFIKGPGFAHKSSSERKTEMSRRAML